MEQAQNQGYNELPSKEKPLSVAAQEIFDGKLVATSD
jgi:DNA-directed RNA polymerase subunit K/omega